MVDPGALATWANAITVGRLLLSPLMFWVIPDDPGGAWAAFVLWFLLCVSDAFDGYVARRHGTTRSGAFLDPLADKVLVLGAMFTLVGNGVFWVVPVVIIAAREFVISMYRTVVGSKGVSVPASRMAKNKTLAQQLAVGFALLPLTALDATWLWTSLLWIAVVLALASGWSLPARQPGATVGGAAAHRILSAVSIARSLEDSLGSPRRSLARSRTRSARRVDRSLARGLARLAQRATIGAMRCDVLAVGTELLLGQINDTNSSWIGDRLALHGIGSLMQVKVGDNVGRIEAALRSLLDGADAIIVTGGLGPTHDDVTREAIAAVMGGVDLVEDAVVADVIRELFASRGRRMPENNLRQALVPVGAIVIPQTRGTAPGLICPVGDKVIYAVPGVPHEMKDMLERAILPDLVARSGDSAVIASRVLKTWGESESGLNERLDGIIARLEELGNPTMAFLAVAGRVWRCA